MTRAIIGIGVLLIISFGVYLTLKICNHKRMKEAEQAELQHQEDKKK